MATKTPKGTRQSGYKRQYVWAVINHRVTNTSNHHQLGAKVLNAQIQTPLMTMVKENADEVVTKIAQTTPQIAELCIIKGATLTGQHQIHPIEV